jgi:TolA-binding protein
MKLLLVISISFSLGLTLFAQQNWTLQEAIAPLRDGVPEVAVQRLKTLLARNPPLPDKSAAEEKLGEALFLADRPAEALDVLRTSGLPNPATVFWQAQCLAALDRWAEALPLYQQIARGNEKSPYYWEAIFGTAQALRALGKVPEAISALSSLQKSPPWATRSKLGRVQLLLDRGDLVQAGRLLRETKPENANERNERRFLFGRLNLELNRPDRAIETLEVLVKKPEGVLHRLLFATLLTLAEAHLRTQTPEAGDDALEEFIDHRPNDSALPEIFAKLDELYRHERKPSTNELERWMHDAAQPRQSLAQLYLARSLLRAGRRDEAIALLTELRDSKLQFPSLGQASLELAHLHLEMRDYAAVIADAQAAQAQNSSPDFKQRADWLIAEAYYRSGQLEKAAPIYEQIARHSALHGGDALFNAALCWLRLDRPNEFADDYRKVSNDPSQSALQGEMLLEKGAIQAAQSKPEAAQTFRKFIADFPQSPRLSEAWVALAELAFHAPKPRLEEAQRDLAVARSSHPTALALERADYLAVWLADTKSENDEAVISAASNFLKQHPNSDFAGEVRMKLAEAFYRRQDFANAQTQFELLAQQKPDSPLAEKALFFAARSAMSSMGAGALDHALALLDQAVKLNGDFKWAARNQEAVIERRLGRNREALALYDEVLKNEAKPPDRREAICGKADIYYEMGATDPENYRQAIELYDQLAAEPGVSAHWRNQAGFKKGKALEQLHDRSAALTTYYGVLEETMRPDKSREFFWFYKAGFNAAQLLEEDKDWKSAVAVYRKLVAAGGGRSEEARARLTQLRLEHFLWED